MLAIACAKGFGQLAPVDIDCLQRETLSSAGFLASAMTSYSLVARDRPETGVGRAWTSSTGRTSTEGFRNVRRQNQAGNLPYPQADPSATSAHFECQGDEWSAHAWILVVRAAGPVLPDAIHLVRVSFLMVALYDGRLFLAEGVVG